MIKIIIICFFTPTLAYAGIFGPNNFLECMNDGKVGRSNAEVGFLLDYCEKKFPKLPTIRSANGGGVLCALTPELKIEIGINRNKKTGWVSGTKVLVQEFNDKSVVLTWGDKSQFKLIVNYLDGSFSITNGKDIDYGNCSERN